MLHPINISDTVHAEQILHDDAPATEIDYQRPFFRFIAEKVLVPRKALPGS